MPKPSLMVDLAPGATRLLLVMDGVDRLRGTLPAMEPHSMAALAQLVDGLARLVSDDLCVVLCADAWGVTRGQSWSTICDEDLGCNVGHLDCEWSDNEFERLRDRLGEVMRS